MSGGPSDNLVQVRSAPLRRVSGVRVVATGSYTPDNVVRNEDLASLGFDSDWIIQRTGVRERRHALPEQATSDLAIEAARRAIAAAEVNPADIDLLVLGTFTPDQPVPATACVVQDKLGLNCPAMDVQAACAGFMFALVTGMQFVAAGTSRLALVIGADLNSRIVNPADKKVFPIFGDGAGAVLLEPGNIEQGLLAYTLGSDGSGMPLLCTTMGGTRQRPTPEGLAAGDHFLKMDGRPVFKWAVRLVAQSCREVLRHAKLPIEEVDYFVFHQANRRILDALADELGIPSEKLAVNIERYGNTSAGSIPLVLDELVQAGKVRRGSNLLLSGFGAGLAWGTGLLRW